MQKNDKIMNTAIKGMSGYKTNNTKALQKKARKQNEFIWLLKG